jgi:hypothetical protein
VIIGHKYLVTVLSLSQSQFDDIRQSEIQHNITKIIEKPAHFIASILINPKITWAKATVPTAFSSPLRPALLNAALQPPLNRSWLYHYNGAFHN